jgi:hypothetical protein
MRAGWSRAVQQGRFSSQLGMVAAEKRDRSSAGVNLACDLKPI